MVVAGQLAEELGLDGRTQGGDVIEAWNGIDLLEKLDCVFFEKVIFFRNNGKIKNNERHEIE